jgi:ATP-dependent helicase YprA (DUF1998 family)/very-short-patch-repair endonuclease
MDVFDLRNKVIEEYGSYIDSFLTVKNDRISELVDRELAGGFLWPDSLVQLNPAFQAGDTFEGLVRDGVLHPECEKIFCVKDPSGTVGEKIRPHRHQVESIHAARSGDNYVLTTGTGSGKSLAYIVPIVDCVLRNGSGKGIQAIVVYPMNALANSQMGELGKFLCRGYPEGHPPVTFRRYTGQESEEERKEIIANPPDILLTNYVMLELVLTRPWESNLVQSAKGLRFLVLDELHTYRGRQGADVAMLVRRVREACRADKLIHVGTSATLAGGGSWEEQQEEVADMASRLFGTKVRPERIIGETLRRVTPDHKLDDPKFSNALKTCIQNDDLPTAGESNAFIDHPLSSWIESTLGLTKENGSDRLVRCKPMSLSGSQGAAARLSEITKLDVEQCDLALRKALLSGYQCQDEHDRPIFAFRLNQFVSKGESVYASLESEEDRHVTLQVQWFVPNDRHKILLPLAFCRECGQEYYLVRRSEYEEGKIRYLPRGLTDNIDDDGGEPGFLHIGTTDPWPSEGAQVLERLPDAWLEVSGEKTTVRKARRDRLPKEIFLSTAGVEGAGKQRAHYMRAPFIFCMNCKVAYSPNQRSDFGKLATLGSEGRSTATTVMTLSTIRRLRHDQDLKKNAKKLLSFTDNRQDASLQAGHFNDFVEIGLLRSALWQAVHTAQAEGIRHENLTQRVFGALNLPLKLYASNPSVEYHQLEETNRALRQAIGYCLYRDLRRGWRVTSPNLEQCGLLEIDYSSLRPFCEDQAKWESLHPALAAATPEQREEICRVFLDHLRRELAIRVNFLDPIEQESIRQLSGQYLVPPWSLDELEQLERSRIAFPRSAGKSRGPKDYFVYISPRGGLGFFLKRPDTFAGFEGILKTQDAEQIIRQLLQALTIPGLVHEAMPPRDADDVPGYQLNASAMIWRAGDGQKAFHDPVRVPNAPKEGLRPNPFFKEFYRQDLGDLKDLKAHEHTAQVPYEVREEREEAFREARLPILYCSPTMELGVDIAQLNVVNMRNIPPTPANYAQRSGRAGRSGQPAFVFAYCSAGSPHDQYFFKHPDDMVSGAVTTPRLDLANEDLIMAHVHAVWLSVVGLPLGSNLAEVLDVEGEDPTLDLLPKVKDALADTQAREKVLQRAQKALGEAIEGLIDPEGSVEDWLKRVLDSLPRSFDKACERWRNLFLSALNQAKRQTKIVHDASREPEDRKRAKRLRAEAEAQRDLLLERGSEFHSDFYSYRYFASEGFLPGYSFPRLPLSAYLPGRRRKKGTEEFLTRPRFLAISEFGPRSFIYHEGSRYVVNKVIIPVEYEEGKVKRRAAQCKACGYLHPLGDEPSQDLCEYCGTQLPYPYDNLFNLQNVSTRRRDRINSDEEERFRMGYELKTGIRFAVRGGKKSAQQAALKDKNGEELASLVYGHAATIWRLNLGWRRRQNKDQAGYILDTERGYWANNKAVDDDPADPMTALTERVIPFVEDRRNCILLRPAGGLSNEAMASLQAALKASIQVHFQLEDRELATEPLPNDDDRRLILLYEAAEGGAGVLRRLVEDAKALPRVAKIALDICHFDPETGEDRKRAPNAPEDCEAACYDCLLSYYNQRDHQYLDRKLLSKLLLSWASGKVATSPTPVPRDQQIKRLLKLCDSNQERKWLDLVDKLNLKLPSHAQHFIESCKVRLDFFHQSEGAAIFIDGPHHDTPEQKAKDDKQQDDLENEGYTVIRFHHKVDWKEILEKYPSLFGKIEEKK